MHTCVKWIKISMTGWGVIREERCGRDAPHLDVHGRWLCNRHYKQWVSKMAKKGIVIKTTKTP